jgi:hypothetical protein
VDAATEFILTELAKARDVFAHRRKRDKTKAVGLQIATVTFSAAITVLLGLKTGSGTATLFKNVALALGALITTLSAYDAFYNHRGLWIQRSITLERLSQLQRECNFELSLTGSLPDGRPGYYLEQLNKLIDQDRRDWLKLRSPESSPIEFKSPD